MTLPSNRMLFSIVCLIFFFSAVEIVHSDVLYARSSYDFIDSIGVACHWDHSDSYAQFDGVLAGLQEMGITQYRDGIYLNTFPKYQRLAQAGIKACFVVDLYLGTVENGLELIKRFIASTGRPAQDVVACIEGPNEPDLFWGGQKYKGKGYFEGGHFDFMRDLYAAVKNDPILRSIPVIGMAIGNVWTYDTTRTWPPGVWPEGILNTSVDWGNVHPYPVVENLYGNAYSWREYSYGGVQNYWWVNTQPTIKLGGPAAPNNWMLDVPTIPYKPKPMAVTEVGYSTFKDRIPPWAPTTKFSGALEVAVAKYMPRLYAGYFALGIKKTFVYELMDERNNINDIEQNWGFMRYDLSKKPHFYSTKSLIQFLKEPGVGPFSTGYLNFNLQLSPSNPLWNEPKYIQKLLLQKSNGDFYFLFWNEVTSEDASTNPRTLVNAAPFTATLSFNYPFSAIEVYHYTRAWNIAMWAQYSNANSVTFGVWDTVTFVVLKNYQAPRATADEFVQNLDSEDFSISDNIVSNSNNSNNSGTMNVLVWVLVALSCLILILVIAAVVMLTKFLRANK